MIKKFALALAVMAGAGTAAMAQGDSGALIKGGDLEGCAPGSLPSGWGIEKESGAQGSVGSDETQAHSGKRSVLINKTSASGYLHPSFCAKIKPGFYTLRLWAKMQPAQSFFMQVYDARKWAEKKPASFQLDGKGILSKEVSAADGEWNKFELDFEVTEEFPASFQIGLTKEGKLWLDDIELVSTKKPRSLTLSDLGGRFSAPLTAEQQLKCEGWNDISGTDFQFANDVCLSNKSLNVVMRKGAKGVELNYPAANGFAKAGSFMPLGSKGERAASLEDVKVVYNTANKAIVDVVFKGDKGSKMGLRLIGAPDKPFVETQPLGATDSLRIEHAASAAVMPDIVGNDLVISADKVSSSKLRLPSSQQTDILNFIDNGNAIMMCVWESSNQNATVELQGEGAKRVLSATEIEYDKARCENVWVAVLSAPGIWHQAKMAGIDVKGKKLDWKRPLDPKIHWRADFRRDPDGLVDSWFVIRQGKDGNWPGCLPGKGRTVWCTYCSNFPYPAYVEDNAVCLANSSFDGYLTNTCYKEPGDSTFNEDENVIIYPYEYLGSASSNGSPIYVREVLRSALADTRMARLNELMYPQQIPTHRFMPTCANTKKVEKLFETNEHGLKADETLKLIRHLRYFVWSVRERSEEQLAWSKEMRKFYAEKKKANPKLAPVADMFDETTARIEAVYKRQLPTMQQPSDCGKYIDMLEKLLLAKTDADVVAVANELRALKVDVKPDDEKDRGVLAKLIGPLIRTVGGSQDACTGRMRQVVKALHQQAGIASLAAQDDATFEFISEVRAKTTSHMAVYGGHEPGFISL